MHRSKSKMHPPDRTLSINVVINMSELLVHITINTTQSNITIEFSHVNLHICIYESHHNIVSLTTTKQTPTLFMCIIFNAFNSIFYVSLTSDIYTKTMPSYDACSHDRMFYVYGLLIESTEKSHLHQVLCVHV